MDDRGWPVHVPHQTRRQLYVEVPGLCSKVHLSRSSHFEAHSTMSLWHSDRFAVLARHLFVHSQRPDAPTRGICYGLTAVCPICHLSVHQALPSFVVWCLFAVSLSQKKANSPWSCESVRSSVFSYQAKTGYRPYSQHALGP